MSYPYDPPGVQVNRRLKRGTRLDELVSLVDDVTGLPFDSTGYVPTGNVKAICSDAAIVATMTITPNPLTATGVFSFLLDTESRFSYSRANQGMKSIKGG